MKSYGQLCSVARALDIVGDRWSLLIVRELLIGGRLRFTDLERGLPGIAPNLLSQRLRDLTDAGVLEKPAGAQPGQGRVYELTPRGRALDGVMRELLKWGAPTVPEAPGDAIFQMHWLSQPARYLLRDRLPDQSPVVIRFGEAADGFDLTVAAGQVRTGPCQPNIEPQATVHGPGPALVGFIQGRVPLRSAPSAGIAIEGDLAALERVLPAS